jgi:cell wall assembly regulator SMI1
MLKPDTQAGALSGVVVKKAGAEKQQNDKENTMTDIHWKYVKSLVKKDAVEEFEGKHNISLPDDLKQCIRLNNGGRPDKNIFDTDKSKERVFKTLLSFNENDVENIYKYFPVIHSENPALIPFASDPGGNFICVKDGAVVLFLHETGGIEQVASSYSKFLNKLYG